MPSTTISNKHIYINHSIAENPGTRSFYSALKNTERHVAQSLGYKCIHEDRFRIRCTWANSHCCCGGGWKHPNLQFQSLQCVFQGSWWGLQVVSQLWHTISTRTNHTWTNVPPRNSSVWANIIFFSLSMHTKVPMNVLPSVILIRALKFKYELRRLMFSVLATMVLLDPVKQWKLFFCLNQTSDNTCSGSW